MAHGKHAAALGESVGREVKTKKQERITAVECERQSGRDYIETQRKRGREKKSEFLFVIVESPVPGYVVIPVVRYTRYLLIPIYYYNKYTTVVYRATTCVSFYIMLLYTIIIL